MKNEKGITLIELLAAVVIAGIVIVPLLTIMTGTFTRTACSRKRNTTYVFRTRSDGKREKVMDMILPKRCITVRKVADVIFSDDVD